MSAPTSKTITIFLLDGDPTGTKKVQLGNWSGMAFIIPRNKLEIVNERDELQKQCVYFLIGGTSVTPEVYIGEAENFKRRISGHQSKDFWNTCIVFSAKDENLTKAHVRFLEAQFVLDCRKANRANLHNANLPDGSKLSEEQESEMEEFMQNMKLVLSSLGYTFHQAMTVASPYYISSKGLKASAAFYSEGIMVLKGSQVSKQEAPSIPLTLKALRFEKLSDTTLIDRNTHYEVVQNLTFSSVSTAAGFVLGRSANGWMEWKNKEGKTIDEVERNKNSE